MDLMGKMGWLRISPSTISHEPHACLIGGYISCVWKYSYQFKASWSNSCWRGILIPRNLWCISAKNITSYVCSSSLHANCYNPKRSNASTADAFKYQKKVSVLGSWKLLKDNFDIRLLLFPFPFITGDGSSCKSWSWIVQSHCRYWFH